MSRTPSPTPAAGVLGRDLSPPPGVTLVEGGADVAVYAGHADGVDVCLFEPGDTEGTSERRVPLLERAHGWWFGFVPGMRPGQRYNVRVAGEWGPDTGLRHNAAKLLLDPYARAVEGRVTWGPEVYGHVVDAGWHGDGDLPSDLDSRGCVPRCVVVDDAFDWEGDRPPGRTRSETVIYEAHVRNQTALHPDVPAELRGTYAGLAHPASVAHLRGLGVTAVELLPVHAFLDDRHLLEKGLRNYWGYNSINFFAPEARYASSRQAGGQVTEFKQMVKTLHAAGIEVILDVVYNHTAEGNHLGPTLSFRGIDNASYYRLVPDDPRFYMDYTGTGNTLNAVHPQVLQLIMDSLRYWVQEMHVDGFRFDLASALARELHDVDRLGSFFDVIHQDPVLSRVKLIGEPWDIAEGGYQVGNFPALWSEWNDKYRDSVRDYWKAGDVSISELAYRLTGSSDLYQGDGRRPYASINFVTAHD
ncbi:MAG: glycogen debranching protein GlgX, partial [Ornithinibacter sp.]